MPRKSEIPVGPDGFVPEAELLKRYREFYNERQAEYDERREDRALDIELGLTSKGRMPRINLAKKDYDTTSDYVIPLRCTPEQVAAWWHDPTCCDVQDIDTAGAPKVHIPKGMTPEQKKDQGKIRVVSTPSEEQKFRRELVATYTPEEIRKFAATRPTVAIKPTGVGNAGSYNSITGRMELDRYDGLNMVTISHEGGHHLRATDPDRTDPIVRRNPMACIEESCTVAEQQARSDKPDYNGYYANVAVYDQKKHAWRKPTIGEARRMAEEDHALFTYGRQTGLSGDDALRSVQENWSRSHISRLRYHSNKMAINEMADMYGNVDRVSMAQPRTRKQEETMRDIALTNATAGMPGVAVAARKQTTLFSRRGR